MLGMRTLTYSASFYEEEEEKIVSKKEDAKDERKEAVQMGLTVALSVVIALLAFVVLPYGLSQMLSSRISSFAVLGLIEGLIRIVLFVGYVIAISYMRDINRTFMYHGAEHKAINCIENGLELTPENVRRQSRYHKRCGAPMRVQLCGLLCGGRAVQYTLLAPDSSLCRLHSQPDDLLGNEHERLQRHKVLLCGSGSRGVLFRSNGPCVQGSR